MLTIDPRIFGGLSVSRIYNGVVTIIFGGDGEFDQTTQKQLPEGRGRARRPLHCGAPAKETSPKSSASLNMEINMNS